MDARAVNTWQKRMQNSQNLHVANNRRGLPSKGFHSLFCPGGISLIAPCLLHLNALHFSQELSKSTKSDPVVKVLLINRTSLP